MVLVSSLKTVQCWSDLKILQKQVVASTKITMAGLKKLDTMVKSIAHAL